MNLTCKSRECHSSEGKGSIESQCVFVKKRRNKTVTQLQSEKDYVERLVGRKGGGGGGGSCVPSLEN